MSEDLVIIPNYISRTPLGEQRRDVGELIIIVISSLAINSPRHLSAVSPAYSLLLSGH